MRIALLLGICLLGTVVFGTEITDKLGEIPIGSAEDQVNREESSVYFIPAEPHFFSVNSFLGRITIWDGVDGRFKIFSYPDCRFIRAIQANEYPFQFDETTMGFELLSDKLMIINNFGRDLYAINLEDKTKVMLSQSVSENGKCFAVVKDKLLVLDKNRKISVYDQSLQTVKIESCFKSNQLDNLLHWQKADYFYEYGFGDYFTIDGKTRLYELYELSYYINKRKVVTFPKAGPYRFYDDEKVRSPLVYLDSSGMLFFLLVLKDHLELYNYTPPY